MILRPEPAPHSHGSLPGSAAAVPAAPAPGWLRGAVPDAQGLGSQGLGDVALVAGAALGALDAVVRRRERWASYGWNWVTGPIRRRVDPVLQ